jgi:hypothetical protein
MNETEWNGWDELIDSTTEKLKHIDPNYQIRQIKSKFGELRYYFRPSDGALPIESRIMDDIVDYATYRSQSICERCSKGGKTVVVNHWLYTLCPDCEKHVKERKFF